MNDGPKLFGIVGPTASGKSEVALEVAERLGAEILSVDSRQIFRGFDIGTAKPTAAERARVPHHGLDLCEPDRRFSAHDFDEAGQRVVRDAWSRGVPLLVVGGTGLWLRALLFGLGPAVPSNPQLRSELRFDESAAPGAMHARLQAVDAPRAAQLHPHDLIRIERAIEIHAATGVPASRWNEEHGFQKPRMPFLVRWVRREREDLRTRIERRAEAMLADGWIDEVQALSARGVASDTPGFCSLGYPDVLAFCRGEIDAETLRTRVVHATRQLAKRQATWFHSAPEAQPVDAGPRLAERLVADARAFLERFP